MIECHVYIYRIPIQIRVGGEDGARGKEKGGEGNLGLDGWI